METVEELCESIAIVDLGRVVISGAVRDVKRSMNRQVVRLATDGDGNGVEWVKELPGISVIAERADYVELRVPADRDPETILRTAMDRGDRVTRFEISDPSLEEIFIEHVGRRAIDEDEEHLARTGAAEPR
jgi:ABC-2 type transport system ATP-binding protein